MTKQNLHYMMKASGLELKFLIRSSGFLHMNSQKGILLFSFLSSLFFYNCNAQSSMNFQRAHENKIIKKIKDNPKTFAAILASTSLILGVVIGVGIDELVRRLKSKKTNNIDNNVNKKTNSSDIGKTECVCSDTIINKDRDNVVCCKNCYYLLHEKCYNKMKEVTEKIKLTCSECKKQNELGEGYVQLYCKCGGSGKFKSALHNKYRQCPNCRAYNSYMKLDDENFFPIEKAFETYKFASEYAQNKIEEQKTELQKEVNVKLQALEKKKRKLNEKLIFK